VSAVHPGLRVHLFGERPRLLPDFWSGELILALTFKQPFGSCICPGPKRAENRDWSPWRALQRRPFWIAIHAGAGWYAGVERHDLTLPRFAFEDEPAGAGGPPLWAAAPAFADMPPRAFLGAARVVGVAEVPDDGELCPDPWAFGPWAWVLDPAVVVLPTPIPWAGGGRGLWPVPPAVLEELRRARGDARCLVRHPSPLLEHALKMPDLEIPTLEQLFGAPLPNQAEQRAAVRALDTLEAADRVLLCPDLPTTVRAAAEGQQRVLAELQAVAGQDQRLRGLLVEQRVASRPGAVRLCKRLINAIRAGGAP